MAVNLPADLHAEALAEVLGDRPVRTYPALLSTHADALAWARAGGPAGGLVVADYQAAPRGRAGQPWHVNPGKDLGFSLLLRPALAPEREGWLYVAATTGLADALGDDTRLVWPDTVERAGEVAAAVGVEAAPAALEWAVLTVLLPGLGEQRRHVLARVVEAIEERLGGGMAEVLDRYRPRCRTFGRRVRARLIPLGPGGPEVVGAAEDVALDGALLVRTDRGTRVGVRPGHLGVLEDAGTA